MMTAVAAMPALETEFGFCIDALRRWLVERDYAGFEPYDLLNSRYLKKWARRQPFASVFVQSGKRAGGLRLRRILRVPVGRTPKGLGLVLSSYCDLISAGWSCRKEAERVQRLLVCSRCPDEREYSWGYDWHYVSLRGVRMPAFSPNSVVTTFCGEALLDYHERFGGTSCLRAAHSAAEWLTTRLNRTLDNDLALCFSYTPHDGSRILNNNALIGAFFARISQAAGPERFRQEARRLMGYLAAHQAEDGSWPYGLSLAQRWIDSFHTGYNLTSLRRYQEATGDRSFAANLERGYEFYKRTFFRADGVPLFFHNRRYPIDIHACSQAILTFCQFSEVDAGALTFAQRIARWTVAHLRNEDGSFGYMMHRWRTDRTPYVRWSQAWMFRALAQLQLKLLGVQA